MEIRIDNAAKDLIDFRIKHGVTQEKLALKTGVTRQTISAIEQDRLKPQAVTLFKINEYVKTFGE